MFRYMYQIALYKTKRLVQCTVVFWVYEWEDFIQKRKTMRVLSQSHQSNNGCIFNCCQFVRFILVVCFNLVLKFG